MRVELFTLWAELLTVQGGLGLSGSVYELSR